MGEYRSKIQDARYKIQDVIQRRSRVMWLQEYMWRYKDETVEMEWIQVTQNQVTGRPWYTMKGLQLQKKQPDAVRIPIPTDT